MVPPFDAFGDHRLLIVFLERVQSPQSKWNEAGELTVQRSWKFCCLRLDCSATWGREQ